MDLFITVLLFAGCIFLLLSLFSIWKIISKVGVTGVKYHWYTLFSLVCFFLCGYIAYAWFSWGSYSGLIDMLVPVIFFFGAFFVLLVTMLSLKTTQELLRTFELERDSITDRLLGIYNRRYLDRRLPEEFISSKRYEYELSVIMIDLDQFKVVNDTWGHQVGDKVLQEVARLVKDRIRETDILCRYGGEELFLILPYTACSAAMIVAEEIRRVIDKSEVHGIPVTASFGIATLSDLVDTVEVLIEQADKALYRAKQSGRNRIEHYLHCNDS